jgi:hypothetical protein
MEVVINHTKISIIKVSSNLNTNVTGYGDVVAVHRTLMISPQDCD